MKKVFVYSAMLLAAISCNKETPASEISEAGDCSTVTITAEFCDDSQSKSYLGDGGSKLVQYWEPGDKISVFFGENDVNTEFTAAISEAAIKAPFNGQISGVVGGEGSEAGNYLWGLNPYDADAHCDGTVISTVLKTQQRCEAGRAAADQVMNAAKSESFYMSFYQVPAYGKFYLNTEGITSIDVKANDGSKIAGAFTVGFEDGVPAIVTRSGSDVITLVPANGDTFLTGSDNLYFFSMLPGTIEGGITFTFHIGDCLEGTRVVGASGLAMNRANGRQLGSAGADDPNNTTWEESTDVTGNTEDFSNRDYQTESLTIRNQGDF